MNIKEKGEMMRNLLITISMCIILVSCGDDKMQKTGLFSGTVGKKDYKIEVACFKNGNKDYIFTFLSDENGDGIVISGVVWDGSFNIDISENGKKYSFPTLIEFLRGDNKVEGSGTIPEFNNGTITEYDFKFTLTCKSYI